MLRLFVATLALSASAGAQTDLQVTQAIMEGVVSIAQENGNEIVAGPLLAEHLDALDTVHRLDLEAGASYVLAVMTRPDAGFTPDVVVIGPSGGSVGEGTVNGGGFMMMVSAREAGPHVIEVRVAGPRSGPRAYGLIVLRESGS
ncbi:hypothetical protein [Rubrivirga sp.]|uniref:hypothetical protein n=1 Tax=Rubrivirga sp. TaxID=1885344 RepID=UPI003C73A22D